MRVVIYNETRFAHDLVYSFGNATRTRSIAAGGSVTIDEAPGIIAGIIASQARYGMVPQGTAGGGLSYETVDE